MPLVLCEIVSIMDYQVNDLGQQGQVCYILPIIYYIQTSLLSTVTLFMIK